MPFSYYLIYKPYGMLSQFSPEAEGQITLADFPCQFPPQVYPVGRLDADSEGLLLLTDDKKLTESLLNPNNRHARTYYVQVEGIPDEKALEALRKGVEIKLPNKKLYRTLPAKVEVLSEEPALPERVPPIRYRANIPTTWISITLTEGKNRQVRKMTAKVGFPTLRLVRVKIGNTELGDLKPGEWRMIDGIVY